MSTTTTTTTTKTVTMTSVHGFYPSTHPAVSVMGKRQPLAIRNVPTVAPGPGEAVVHVEWTASTPLDLHQADGGLLIKPPHISGSSFAGTVAALGPENKSAGKPDAAPLKVGDRVFGMAFASQAQRGHQTYMTAPTNLMGRVPENLTMSEAVTAPTNLITALHTTTTDLRLEIPWPRPENWEPRERDTPILIWGAASSVGVFTLQVLRHWGYRNVLAVASGKHHPYLREELGASACFDYRDENVTDQINEHIQKNGNKLRHILDCIGSIPGTLRPLTRVAASGATVAVMLPVIVRDATAETEPIYEMDVHRADCGAWAQGVELRGVRTHHYEQNEFFKTHLQQDIIPALLSQGVVHPNKQRLVEGESLLDRASDALDLLRQRAPSGEKLVWRVAE